MDHFFSQGLRVLYTAQVIGSTQKSLVNSALNNLEYWTVASNMFHRQFQLLALGWRRRLISITSMIRKIVVREGSYAFYTPLHETNSNWVLHSNVHREDCNDDGYGDLFWIGCPALQSEWQVTVRTRFLFLFFFPDTVIPITLASSSNRNIIATHILTLFFFFGPTSCWKSSLLSIKRLYMVCWA